LSLIFKKKPNTDSDLEITEILIDPVKTQNRYWEMANSAVDEMLVLFSSANAFARQERVGSIEIMKNLALEKTGLKVRILLPESNHVREVRSALQRDVDNINIKFIQEFSQTKISIVIVDRRRSIVTEVKNDDASTTLEAIGQSTYSTRILTVLSYVSIFESYWALSQMYEESVNELASTKEYLDKVLKEIDHNKTR
jgi:two-component system sensor histidine kinase VicK